MAGGRTVDQTTLDVVGVGALNLDFVVPRSTIPLGLRRRIDERLGENLEALVDDDEVDGYLRSYGDSRVSVPRGRLGGSTFNAIRTICELDLGLRTGYVGVVGRPEGDGFLEFFARRGVDTTFLCEVDFPSSKCFAQIEKTKQRKLLTGLGATRFFQQSLAARTDVEEPGAGTGKSLVAYLAASRWVHVTSFHDLTTLDFVRRHVEAARQRNPGLQVSFDPGYQYAEDRDPEVKNFAQLSDYLFLSEVEFEKLARVSDSEGKVPTRNIAAKLFDWLEAEPQVVVVKGRSSTEIIRLHEGTPAVSRYWHRRLRRGQIRDDVGAGDVFAGGFIAAHLRPVFDEFGRGPTKLGSALVAAKMANPDDEGYARFKSIAAVLVSRRRRREHFNLRDLASLHGRSMRTFMLGVAAGLVAGVPAGVVANALFRWLSGS